MELVQESNLSFPVLIYLRSHEGTITVSTCNLVLPTTNYTIRTGLFCCIGHAFLPLRALTQPTHPIIVLPPHCQPCITRELTSGVARPAKAPNLNHSALIYVDGRRLPRRFGSLGGRRKVNHVRPQCLCVLPVAFTGPHYALILQMNNCSCGMQGKQEHHHPDAQETYNGSTIDEFREEGS